MEPNHELSQISRQLDALTTSIQANETRLRTMERWNRRLGAGLLGALGVSLYLGYSVASSPLALAEDLVATGAVPVASSADVKGAVDAAVSNAMADGAISKDELPVFIMKFLGDIQAALQAVPQMSKNMETMSRDMTVMTANVDQMNHKMTVMTGSINSTMGRMGRMMPWW